MSLNESYFKIFDLERLGIDKVLMTVYDRKYTMVDHDFDFELRDKFIRNVKRSQIYGKRFEQVIRKEADYSSWELQLKGSRLMRFHVNIIHFLQDMHDIRPANVIYDDNYLPVNSKLTIIDHVKALRLAAEHAKKMYADILMKYWGYAAADVRVKFSSIELPFEVYPASVDDLAGRLQATGVSFSRYNTQSGTLYMNRAENDLKVSRRERKYDKIDGINDHDLTPVDVPVIPRNIVYWNRLKGGLNKSDVQLKIYQKTHGLCRIEFTIKSEDARMLFNFDLDDGGSPVVSDEDICSDLISFIHYNLQSWDIDVKRYDRTLDDVVRFIAKAFKEDEDLVYSLRTLGTFEGLTKNRVARQRLVRKGILLPHEDSNGAVQRGVYTVNPIIKEFLNLRRPTGSEHFVKNPLFPDL